MKAYFISSPARRYSALFLGSLTPHCSLTYCLLLPLALECLISCFLQLPFPAVHHLWCQPQPMLNLSHALPACLRHLQRLELKFSRATFRWSFFLVITGRLAQCTVLTDSPRFDDTHSDS